jgi:hypothetical protein
MGERPDYGFASKAPKLPEHIAYFEGEKKILRVPAKEPAVFDEAQSARIRKFLDLDQGGVSPIAGSEKPPEWMSNPTKVMF